MCKIIIVDDHLLFREGIKLLIENEDFGKVIGVAKNSFEFLELMETHHPDLVLMNIEMPHMTGLKATRIAMNVRPNLKILVLSMISDNVSTADIRKSGAAGSLMKSAGKKEFEKAFKTILAGEQYYDI